jgi:hypothetical protein
LKPRLDRPRTGRSRNQSTQRNPQRGTNLALTFGTLLSSQRADARDTRLSGLRSRRLFHVTPLSLSVKRRVRDLHSTLGVVAPSATGVPQVVFLGPAQPLGTQRLVRPAGR